MNPNSSSPSHTKKEDIPADDQPTDRQFSELLKKVADTYTNVINGNIKVIQDSAALAATNETVAATIGDLLATNKVLAAFLKENLNHNHLAMDSASELQPSTSRIAPPKDWENHYSVLNEDQRRDPVKILSEFVRLDTLFKQRENLLMMYTAALQSPMNEEDNAEAKSDQFFLYNMLILLMEGVYRAVELIKKSQLTFIYAAKQ